MRMRLAVWLLWLAAALPAAGADVGNRLAWVDDACNPYYVGLDAPKLVTPQWIGQEGVQAVIVLSIDDMRSTAPYEKCLRPIIERLKKIDGRGPVSIMTSQADPVDPQLATWAAEGVTVEAHTATHPCPCLQGSDLAKAKRDSGDYEDFLANVIGKAAQDMEPMDATLAKYADLPQFKHLQNYGDLHRANMNRAFTEFESQ